MRKKVKLFLGLLMIAFLIAFILWRWMSPLELKTITLQKGDLVRDFKESGKIETSSKISFTPAFDGEVIFIAKEGSKVKKGSVLLELNAKELIYQKEELMATRASIGGQEQMSVPVVHDSQMQAADIAIQMAEEAVLRGEEDLEKYQALYQEGAVAQVEYEQAKRVYEDAKKQLDLKVNQKKVLMDQTKVQPGSETFYKNQQQAISVKMMNIEDKLSNQVIYAEGDGLITGIYAQKGDFVSRIQKVMEISSLEDMKVVCDILSSDALGLKIGQQVKLIQKIGEQKIERLGEIVEIASYAKTKVSSLGLEEQRVQVKIKPLDDEALILGMDMDVIFETMRLENVLSLPKSSVVEAEKFYVWKIQEGLLVKQVVTIGRESDYHYEILSGLKESDLIVVNPDNADLKEGKKAKAL